MPEVSSLIALGAVVLVVMILFMTLKSIVKTVVLVIISIAIVLIALTILVMNDAQLLKKNLVMEDNLFLLMQNSSAVAGIGLNADSDPKFLTQNELNEVTNNINKKDYQAIKGNYFKVFILQEDIIEESNEGTKRAFKKASNYQERTILLAPLLEDLFSDPVLLIAEYKKGNVEIYKETVVFKAVRLTPRFILMSVVGRSIIKTGAIVVNQVES